MHDSFLALVTTVHVAMLLVTQHRVARRSAVIALAPAAAFCIAPWVFHSPEEFAAGVLGHAVWVLCCRRYFWKPVDTPPGGRGFVLARVMSVREETPTIRTFRIARPAHTPCTAGQFLTVRVDVNGAPQVRCYSVSSAPEDAGFFEISVKRQGLVSGALHATVKPGSILQIKPPAGRFVYPSEGNHPMVLIAGGVGITPLISMIRHAAATEPSRPITLLYAARGVLEFAFDAELRRLLSRMVGLTVIRSVTTGLPDAGMRTGRIDGAFVRELVREPAASVFLMCGPHDMIRDLESALLSMGVPADSIRYEVFQPARAIGASAAHASGIAEAAHQLTLQQTGATVTVGAEDSLLDGAERAGASVPSLCRSGVCGTCRTRLVEGRATCTSDALDARERDDGWVLPCVTWAKGDCTLDA